VKKTIGKYAYVILPEVTFHHDSFDSVIPHNFQPTQELVWSSSERGSIGASRLLNLKQHHRMSIFDIASDHERDRIQVRNPYKLSPRELEIATLIGQGLTSRQAGEKLAISYKTVETHRAHIMTKLGARNSAHLAYIIGTLARSHTVRPDIVYIEDFRDAFGRTAQNAANDTTPVIVFAD
jgi:DNA-binding CsgD family transcriptional regulator